MIAAPPETVTAIRRRHWRLERGMVDSAGRIAPAEPTAEIGLLTLDVAEQSTNVLSQDVLRELDERLVLDARAAGARDDVQPLAEVRRY